jgi:hypothetical protein
LPRDIRRHQKVMDFKPGRRYGSGPRVPVRRKAGENFRFNHRSYRVDRIDGDIVTAHNSDEIEMIISAPAELLG